MTLEAMRDSVRLGVATGLEWARDSAGEEKNERSCGDEGEKREY